MRCLYSKRNADFHPIISFIYDILFPLYKQVRLPHFFFFFFFDVSLGRFFLWYLAISENTKKKKLFLNFECVHKLWMWITHILERKIPLNKFFVLIPPIFQILPNCWCLSYIHIYVYIFEANINSAKESKFMESRFMAWRKGIWTRNQ